MSTTTTTTTTASASTSSWSSIVVSHLRKLLAIAQFGAANSYDEDVRESKVKLLGTVFWVWRVAACKLETASNFGDPTSHGRAASKRLGSPNRSRGSKGITWSGLKLCLRYQSTSSADGFEAFLVPDYMGLLGASKDHYRETQGLQKGASLNPTDKESVSNAKNKPEVDECVKEERLWSV